MAKIGVIHYNFPNFTFEEFLKFAADAGCEFVELQATDVWPKDHDHPEQYAEGVKQQLHTFGLRASALAAQNDFVQPDEEAVQFQVERMRRICALANILDPEAVVRSEGGAPKSSVPEDRWLDAMATCFEQCVPFVDELKVPIAIDNHGVITNDGDLLYALLQRVNHPLIGTNLDTMNYRWYGHDVVTCNRFYEMLAPHTLHTHFKDGFGSRAEYRGAALGEGEIDLQFALHHLRKANYTGVFCAEYEGPEASGGVGYRKCVQWLAENV
ncbi:MAG: sugar phosphate isomerase/epimerase [Armatimonadota bacterium]|nr:sugar phosphate isomerase/epimerase [Armatimonadota bacterium]